MKIQSLPVRGGKELVIKHFHPIFSRDGKIPNEQLNILPKSYNFMFFRGLRLIFHEFEDYSKYSSGIILIILELGM
jgi:hypothetical protein